MQTTMLKVLTLLMACLVSIQTFAEKKKEQIILEVMWDDAVRGSVTINDESIWKFPLTEQEETALKNLPASIKEQLSIHSFNPEQNLVRLYANKLFEDRVNVLQYKYVKHTKEYIRYRPSRLGYYLYRTETPKDQDSWVLMDYKQEPIDNSGEMTALINPFNELVPFYIDNFVPMDEELATTADNVRAIYRELTVEIMNGNFTNLETLNPAHKLQFDLFKNKALLNNNQFSCSRGQRTDARIRFMSGAAFVTGNLAACSVITKDGKQEDIQFDYFQYQYDGKDWVLSDFLVRHPRQPSIFPEDSEPSRELGLDIFSEPSAEDSSSAN